MSVEHFFLHLLAVLHGVSASLVTFALFSLAGYGVLPRRWQDTIGRGGHPASIGAALYILLCWYGLQLRIPLSTLAAVFAAVALALGIRARDRVRTLWRAAESGRSLARWAGLFAGLYVLAYSLTLPPVGRDFLPLAWTGSVDLLIYLDYTSYLQRLGPPQPLSLYLAPKDFVYLGLPGLFHLLGGFSAFFAFDTMRAAMPAQFAFIALTGLVTARIVRRAFGATPLAAASVAAAVLSGPFFRYIGANYFLSTLMAMPVMLHLLFATVGHRPQERRLDWPFAVSCAAHAFLLLYLYPFILLIALVFAAGAVTLAALAVWQDARAERSEPGVDGGQASAGAWQTGLSLLLGTAAGLAVVPGQTLYAGRLISDLSETGLWGWPLDVVSPLAMLGLPQSTAHLAVTTPALRPWAIASPWLIGLALFLAFFWWFRRRTTVEERVFAGLSACGLCGYAAYFAAVGPSYQQWKMASYIVLPLSFVGLAALLRLLVHGARTLFPSRSQRAAATATLLVVALALVGGNLAAHAAYDPALKRISGTMRNLAKVEAMTRGRDVWIATPDRPTGMLAAYYLPTKRVHILGPQHYPPVSFDQVGPERPLILPDYGCEGVGHAATTTIEGVGCLLLAPPSLVPETVYPFNRSFLSVTGSGLGPREEWGRWNAGETVSVALTVDRRRVRLDSDARFCNFLLQPFRIPGHEGQRLRATWGAGRQAEVRLAEQGWISLPLHEGDWSGEWLATQTVSFELPDARTPHPAGTDQRPLAAGFLELSLTAQPRGRVLSMLP